MTNKPRVVKQKVYYCPELDEIFIKKNGLFMTYDKDNDIKDAYFYVGYYLCLIGDLFSKE